MPTTAPTAGPVWTPEGVVVVITCVAGVLIPAVIALLQAIKALRQAERANATSDANARRLTSVENQVTAVALNAMPPPPPPTAPAVEWPAVRDVVRDHPKGEL